MTTSTIYNCLFCYGSIRSYNQQKESNLTLQQIISSCKIHLTPEFVAGINWESVSSVNGIFCRECYIIVEKLISLDDQQDVNLKEIKDLGTKLVNRVFRKRRDNEHQSSISYNVGDSVKETRVSKKDALLNGVQDNFPEDNFIADVKVNYRADNEVTNEIQDGSNSSSNSDADLSADETEYNEDEPVASHESISKDKDGTRKKNIKKRSNPDSKKDSAASKSKPKVVVLASEIRRHLENQDTPLTPGFECEKCHRRFSGLAILLRHDCSKSTFECEVCKISFSGTGVLKLHMRSHTGEKPFKCETCVKCFAIKHHFETHMRSHTGEKPYKCDICQKTFREKVQYSRHVLAVHETGKKLFKCDICSKSYNFCSGLKRHLLYHKDERTHKCGKCGKGFFTKTELNQHHIRVNYHSGENPFKCDHCRKAFASKTALNIHIKTHGEKFLCKECGKYFATTKYLALHQLTHPEKSAFICETCGKRYQISVRLKEHIKDYVNERGNKCEICCMPRKGKLKSTQTVLLPNGGESERSDGTSKKMYKGFNSSGDEIIEIKEEKDLSIPDSEIKEEKDLSIPDSEIKEEKDLSIPDSEIKEEEDLSIPDSEIKEEKDLSIPDSEIKEEKDLSIPDSEIKKEKDLSIPDSEIKEEQDLSILDSEIKTEAYCDE